ncbi:MAG: DNA methyltransferase [Methanoregulaceae archaeon]|jgi:type I restriction-modification system DNA methylase subunit
MPLSWNEIIDRAIKFSHDWKDTTSEKAEAQTFWNEFLHIFGIERRRVAVYEKEVEKLGDKKGSIDLFWKGTLLVEHKSKGQSLDKAEYQALDYFQGLEDNELPRYVIVCDFSRFRLYDIDDDIHHDFNLSALVDNLNLFDFIRGFTKKSYKDEDPVNIEAAELMGKLHDSLKENGYSGHPLEMLLVRLMFCFFADDTGIFLPKAHFSYCIETKTKDDGTDTGLYLNQIFEILNTPEERRQTNLDEDFKIFPYINGTLFNEIFPSPSFNTKTRKILLKCCYFDWSKVSPAIFGSMFQSVMNPKMRRNLGAHYTSEKNILKTVNALFLEDLWKNFESNKHNKLNLEILLYDIGKMKFLDPACGCGTFLVISYRELRRLEIQIHKQLRYLEGMHDQKVLDVEMFNRDINVDSMYGIEIEEFPARIAQVALWLVDHQMNRELSAEFGLYYVRLPLTIAPHICVKNALDINWEIIVPKNEVSYILGNPPYSGYHLQSDAQKIDMKRVFSGKILGYGKLDYVCAWYQKALEYIRDTNIEVAFVSTNSITQGEQVGILWEYLIQNGIRINFAHRTFDWSNQAKGNAAVYVVIIGFAMFDRKKKYLYDYSDPFGDPFEIDAKNINPYLIDYSNLIIKTRKKPISDVPIIKKGNIPVDDGKLLMTDEEREEYLIKERGGEKFIRPLASAKEFLHSIPRWCFWLVDASPSELKRLPVLLKRLDDVKKFRSASKKQATKEIANTPMLFGEIRQPQSNFILIPLHSSENRRYIPIAYLPPRFIVHNSCAFIENAKLFHFGILSSSMHMAWVRQVCGRLESRYRYSNDIVYNNFPWPKNLSAKQIQEVVDNVRRVLEVREIYTDSSLADLYDPLTMPKRLIDAHASLDRAVERCYRSQPFTSDLERLKFLFELYEVYTQNNN